MIILISGASHSGKTMLAQRFLEKYQYPYLSLDHLKMGLIRSRNTTLTVQDDQQLVRYLWPIVREIIKTAIENQQNLIVEGCYIPYDWKKDFAEFYLEKIHYICLVMSAKYIKEHLAEIRRYANVIERRAEDTYCTLERLLQEHTAVLKMCQQYQLEYVLIDEDYLTDLESIDTLKGRWE